MAKPASEVGGQSRDDGGTHRAFPETSPLVVTRHPCALPGTCVRGLLAMRKTGSGRPAKSHRGTSTSTE